MHRCVGGVDPLSVAIPRDGSQGVATPREAHQRHCLPLLERLLITISLDLRLARWICREKAILGEIPTNLLSLSRRLSFAILTLNKHLDGSSERTTLQGWVLSLTRDVG